MIPSLSKLKASALIGPETMAAISSSTSRKLLPSLAASEGLVVTPARMPQSLISRISATFAVSIKSFNGSVPSLSRSQSLSSPYGGRFHVLLWKDDLVGDVLKDRAHSSIQLMAEYKRNTLIPR